MFFRASCCLEAILAVLAVDLVSARIAAGNSQGVSSSIKLQLLQTVGTAEDDVSGGVAVDGVGNMYFGTYKAGTGTNFTIRKISSDGAVIFETSPKDLPGGLPAARGRLAVNSNGVLTAIFTYCLGGSLPEYQIYEVRAASFDPAGNQLWVQKIGESYLSIPRYNRPDVSFEPYAAIDSDKNTYFAFPFTKFGLGAGLSASDDEEIAICKLDKNGVLLWVRQIVGGGVQMPSSLAIDSQSNVYVTGVSPSSISAGPFVLAGGGAFLVKYDPNGKVLWAKPAGIGSAVNATDSGWVWMVSNTFSQTTLSRIADNGDTITNFNIGTGLAATAIAAFSENTFVLAGTYGAGSRLGNAQLPLIGSSDIFLATCTSTGQVIDAVGMGSLFPDSVNQIATGTNGLIALTATVQGTFIVGTNYSEGIGKNDTAFALFRSDLGSGSVTNAEGPHLDVH